MSALAALAASQQSYGAEPAGAVDFDGTNDYLSRASDLTGNADGKTFTFSAWVWPVSTVPTQTIYANQGGYFYVATTDGATVFTVWAANTAGTTILNATVSLLTPINTFSHILVSCDLANAANRSVYINDVAQSVTWTTYTNDTIDFTRVGHGVASFSTGSSKNKGRLAHVYLDYTYRDLSNVTNRRLFITADRKPAQGQAALNPILYLPMTDPTQPGKNSGTGGDFTLTGTIARSGRGPNQYNAVYSTLNGTTQYLSRTSIAGIADGKQFTFCCAFSSNTTGPAIVSFASGANGRFAVQTNGGSLQFIAANSANTFILNATVAAADAVVVGRNYVVVASIDLSSTSNRRIFINGVDKTSSTTWTTYTNDNINFSIGTSPTYQIAGSVSSATLNGRLGNVWFNTSYIDLSQPTNLAKFVTGTGIDAKPVDLGVNGELPTGTSPLIYLPMYGNNAGKNYGTGGDFTVNSGPYTGARGPNEFWGNKAVIAVGNYLSRSASLGLASGKTFSLVLRHDNTDIAGSRGVFQLNAGAQSRLSVFYAASGSPAYVGVQAKNSSNALILNLQTTGGWSQGEFTFFCFDLSNTANRFIRGSVSGNYGLTVSTYTNGTIDFAGCDSATVGYAAAVGNSFGGTIAQFFFTTEYIDFSVEANRLKFVDAFGNPADLGSDGSAPTGVKPPIYMRFDPANFGTNSGTGGNFTVTGTITDGGQL